MLMMQMLAVAGSAGAARRMAQALRLRDRRGSTTLEMAFVFIPFVILMIGIGGFARGGDFNRKHANRIMRYRIYAQAGAVALILLYVTLRKYMGQ